MKFLSLYYQSLEPNDFREFAQCIQQSFRNEIHNVTKFETIQLKTFDLDKRIDIEPDLQHFQLLDQGSVLNEYISKIVAYYVVEHLESKIIKHMVKNRCEKMNIDLLKVEKYCYNLLNNDPWEPLGKKFSEEDKARRKLKIYEDLFPILEMNSELNLDGYIAFRMHGYKKEIKDIIEYALDEYVLDQQYEEFMTLLKYFVQLQETKIELVHLVQQDNSGFMLFDDQMKPLELKHEHDRIVAEMLETEINIEDIVISSLISASPQQIVVHTKHREYQVVRSVKSIFGDRATFCNSCSVCHTIHDELMPLQ